MRTLAFTLSSGMIAVGLMIFAISWIRPVIWNSDNQGMDWLGPFIFGLGLCCFLVLKPKINLPAFLLAYWTPRIAVISGMLLGYANIVAIRAMFPKSIVLQASNN